MNYLLEVRKRHSHEYVLDCVQLHIFKTGYNTLRVIKTISERLKISLMEAQKIWAAREILRKES